MFDWLQRLADLAVYGGMGLAPESHLGKAVNFFVYDVVKILILLFAITLLMGVVNAYFPVDRLRAFLSSRRFFGTDHLIAAMFGAVTPFCSCSSVPLFIGFVRGGIPLGVTFAFLITSPLVNVVALAIFFGIFGWKFTVVYGLTAIFLGALAGFVLGRLRLEPLLTKWVHDLWAKAERSRVSYEAEQATFAQRFPGVMREAFGIVKSVLIYIIVGIGVGAAMHGYVPEGFFSTYLNSGQWWSVPAAVIVAVPIYANVAGIIPVIEVLVAKGVPFGTAIAFMMATIGLSIPEATLLRKAMSFRLLAIFFGVVSACIVISGYLLNFVFG